MAPDKQLGLHFWLGAFGDRRYETALHNFDNRPISDDMSKLLKIKKSKNKKTKKLIDRNQLKPIVSKYYVSSRQGVDDKLDLYFKKERNGQSIAHSFNRNKESRKTKVCEKCAGPHSIKECISKDYVCHMCGLAGHRMFECRRAKCYVCLQIGHLGNQCPTRQLQ